MGPVDTLGTERHVEWEYIIPQKYININYIQLDIIRTFEATL